MSTGELEAAQQRIEGFLTGQMLEALRSVDYVMPPLAPSPQSLALAEAARAGVELSHVRGASDAIYLVTAFGEELLMQLQLNVWRLVVIYRVPATQAVDAASLASRLERWRIGAEHAGWRIGWREATSPEEAEERFVETYCYATAAEDFLDSPRRQLYWRTDIVQMTRYFMLEARRCGVPLSPRRAGYRL
jgi:hypothetical protein